MNKKYTHIFFDLDNTLWDFRQNSKFAMQCTFGHFNVSGDKIGFELFFDTYARHNHLLWAAYRNKTVGRKELTRLRFQNTFDELGLQNLVAEEMNAHYLAEMPKQKLLFAGAHELLQYLKNKRYKLNIITNGFHEVQHKKLESSGLRPFFDKIFISEDIKTPKPGRGIFEHAIKSTNAKKEKSIMVGDDWEVDVLGALDFGIDAVYFKPDRSHPFGILDDGDRPRNSVFTAHRLFDLHSVF